MDPCTLLAIIQTFCINHCEGVYVLVAHVSVKPPLKKKTQGVCVMSFVFMVFRSYERIGSFIMLLPKSEAFPNPILDAGTLISVKSLL